ncbi:MAG TPA: phage Gp37/Gp68 family protein [Bryobacteraceae bacterium]|jgi:protein gp37|nr:phage Gp37/Gp68 family protein [Bryobacteraceae bacterium]
MSDHSKIEWTDATWNPVRGCKKISPGCKHCYAETFAERFRGVPNHPYQQGFDLRLVPEKLLEPFLWPSPRMVFVNSMSDLFQDDIASGFIVDVARVMQQAHWHTYQVLTKRAERLREMLNSELAFAANLKHIWWGVSVEDRRYGLPRMQQLQDAPAAMRFLSIEPLLEDLGRLDLRHLHWVIVGGESGPGARPMQPEWVHGILAQCRSTAIPFFFKQWGGRQKRRSGRLLGGRTYDELPVVYKSQIPCRAERIAAAKRFRSHARLSEAAPFGGERISLPILG